MAWPHLLRRFARSDRGVALVEFAIALPLLILVFAVIIEGGRMMWSYQTAVAGVRDAARHLGRIVSSDVCQPGKTFPNHNTLLTTIVRDRINTPGSAGPISVIPTGVTVNSVSSSLACVTGTYRVSPAPVATVTASVSMTFPFAGMIEFAGGSLPTLTTTITDRTRVFGS